MKRFLVALGMICIAGNLNAQDARTVPPPSADSIISADTTEVGVDVTPSATDSRSILSDFGNNQSEGGAKMPVGWKNIDELPLEGPLPGDPEEKRSPMSVRRADGTRMGVIAPSIVATTDAMVFVRRVISTYKLGPEDTVVAGVLPIKSGTTVRYAYVARPGMRLSGAWVREGSVTKWVPSSGTYRFTSRTVLTPIVNDGETSEFVGYKAPYIADPARPAKVVRKVRKPVSKKSATSVTSDKTGRKPGEK